MFKRFPFLRILIPFLTGVALPLDSNPVSFSLLLICLFTLLVLESSRLSDKWKNRKKIGLLLHLLYFLLGLNCFITNPRKTYSIQNCTSFIVHLNKLDKKGEKHDRFSSIVYCKKDDSSFEKINCYTYIPTSIQPINSGTVFITLTQPLPIKSIYNPGSFDFATFAKRSEIYHTLFINNKIEIEILTPKQNSLTTLLLSIRKWIIHTIQSNIKEPSEAGLTEALLIGYKEDLDKSLQQQYSLTGVSHIIAVSGMHLGLIFYVLTTLIGLFSNKKTGRLIELICILPLLWAFALISGASASVLRSVVVFTIMLLGNAILKKAGSINALLASAFFILALNPNLIKDIGFQLSYAAVLSILIFEPLVSKWLCIKNKVLVYLWSMMAITIAAQILTTPIILYHFKQFPVLFLLTNLVAVPLSSLVLLLTIGLCLLSLLHLPTSLLSTTIHICLSAMNNYIGKIAKIPFTTIQISISIATLIIAFVLIMITTLTWTSKQKKIPLPIIITLLMLGLSHQFSKYQLLTTRQIIISQLKNQTFIIHQHGKSADLYCSKRLVDSDSITLKRQLTSVTTELGIQFWQVKILEDRPALIEIRQPNPKGPIFLLTSLDKQMNLIHLLAIKQLVNSDLIADGSNKLWKIRQWEKQAQELHLRLHSTQEKGAFVVPCKHR